VESGNFVTHCRAKVQFAFPELSDKKSVAWVVHIDSQTNPKNAMYDMIIGMDCMCELGIYVNTDDKVITWEGSSIPLKERGQLQDKELLNYLYSMSVDTSKILLEAEERQSRILDANYDRVDPDEFVRGLNHLSVKEQEELSVTLKKYPILFGGGLGVVEEKRKLLVHGILGVARVNSLKRLAFQWSQIATLRAYASQSNSFRRFSFRRFCFRPERKVKILFDESEN
jgi:hypothetical protein